MRVPEYYKGRSPLPERFLHAFRGLKNAWRKEPNFKIEVFFALAVLAGMVILPLTNTQRAILVIVISLVLTLEVINSVIEQVLDVWHPEFSESVARIKDTMAGVVFIGSAASIVVGGLILVQPFVRFDAQVQNFLNFIRTDTVISAAEFLTMLGDWQVALVLSGTVSAVLIAVKKYKLFSLLAGSVFFGQVAVYFLKLFIGRQRPIDAGFNGVSNFSFPSGHVLTATVLFLPLAYIAARHLRKQGKVAVWAAAASLIGIVAATRVILSVHWVSDVVGGALIGFFWFLFWFGINERLFGKKEAGET